jgi:hypothetical protein
LRLSGADVNKPSVKKCDSKKLSGTFPVLRDLRHFLDHYGLIVGSAQVRILPGRCSPPHQRRPGINESLQFGNIRLRQIRGVRPFDEEDLMPLSMRYGCRVRLLSRPAAWVGIRGAMTVTAFAALLPLSHAEAAAIPDGRQSISYAVVQQSLPEVVAAIVGEVGLRAEVSAKVTGDVRGRLPPGSVTETLDRLGSVYGFDWYCDGMTVHVSSASEARTAILPLGPVDAVTFQQTLTAFDIADTRWPVRFSEAGDMALVDGPPSYVALVERTLDVLDRREKNVPVAVTVFRGAAG